MYAVGDHPRLGVRRELIWREFGYHLPCGETAVPMVDASMRELRATGVMHNRVRMIASPFLVKNLRLPWQEGARWFWDTPVDADLASNRLNWRWVAGSGADAAALDAYKRMRADLSSVR